MKTNITRAIVAAVFATAAAAAGAAEFCTYVPGNGQLSVNNPGGGAGFAPVTVTGYSGSGGQFNGNFWDAGAKPADSFFRFFCIELGQVANAGPNLYTSSFLNDDELRKLYDVAYPNKAAGDFWNGAQTNFGVFANATSAAAFQVALWNIAFDTDLDLSAGSFQWTGGVTAVSTAAQTLLNDFESAAAVAECNHPRAGRSWADDHSDPDGEHLSCSGFNEMRPCVVNKLIIGGDAPVRLMGVINCSPESFYANSYIPLDFVHKTAVGMVEQGADIIDIGARSTAPNTQAISGSTEAERIDAALRELDGSGITVSVDTMNPWVLDVCLNHDIHAINDISGLTSPEYAQRLARSELPAFLMASKEKPGDAVGLDATLIALERVTARCETAGIKDYILDPGIGIWTPFRSVKDDWTLCRHFSGFRKFGRPVLAAISRKTLHPSHRNHRPRGSRSLYFFQRANWAPPTRATATAGSAIGGWRLRDRSHGPAPIH